MVSPTLSGLRGGDLREVRFSPGWSGIGLGGDIGFVQDKVLGKNDNEAKNRRRRRPRGGVKTRNV